MYSVRNFRMYSVLTMDGPTVLDDAEAERGDADKLLAGVGRRISIHLYRGAVAYAHVCFLRSYLIATSTGYMYSVGLID